MIIEMLLDLIYTVLTAVLDIIPNLPSFDGNSILSSVDYVFDLIFGHSGLLGFFVRVSTIKLLVPLILLAINFEEVYKLTMWVITKLPIGVKDSSGS